jgi:hypothetical protein
LSRATDFNHQGSQWSAPYRRTLSCTTDFNRKGLNDLPLIRGLCLVPMMDFDHDGSQNTNRSKPKETAVQTRHRESVLPWWRWKIFCWMLGGCLIEARMITALGWGRRLNPKSLWACSNNYTQQGLGRITCLDLIGSSPVTIRDYGTIVHKRKLVLELMLS